MNSYLLVALGSALGGVTRFWLSALVAQRVGEGFPWGTIVVNVSGSFLIGWIDARLDSGASSSRQFLIIGVLGGYTTFSAFSLQTLALARDGRWFFAGGNVLLSVLLCLLAVWLGAACAQALQR